MTWLHGFSPASTFLPHSRLLLPTTAVLPCCTRRIGRREVASSFGQSVRWLGKTDLISFSLTKEQYSHYRYRVALVLPYCSGDFASVKRHIPRREFLSIWKTIYNYYGNADCYPRASYVRHHHKYKSPTYLHSIYNYHCLLT